MRCLTGDYQINRLRCNEGERLCIGLVILDITDVPLLSSCGFLQHPLGGVNSEDRFEVRGQRASYSPVASPQVDA